MNILTCQLDLGKAIQHVGILSKHVGSFLLWNYTVINCKFEVCLLLVKFCRGTHAQVFFGNAGQIPGRPIQLVVLQDDFGTLLSQQVLSQSDRFMRFFTSNKTKGFSSWQVSKPLFYPSRCFSWLVKENNILDFHPPLARQIHQTFQGCLGRWNFMGKTHMKQHQQSELLEPSF